MVGLLKRHAIREEVCQHRAQWELASSEKGSWTDRSKRPPVPKRLDPGEGSPPPRDDDPPL
jgi:hypothetical protein